MDTISIGLFALSCAVVIYYAHVIFTASSEVCLFLIAVQFCSAATLGESAHTFQEMDQGTNATFAMCRDVIHPVSKVGCFTYFS